MDNLALDKNERVLMPVKVDSEMADAIEGYFRGTVKYRDRPNCDELKADCWKAMMAYYAMVDVVRKRPATNDWPGPQPTQPTPQGRYLGADDKP
jgi:hypothetical protein